MCWLCGPASQQPRSLFIGVAHRRSAEPACCLVPARLWEQPLTQEKNNGGIVQKIRSSPGLALVLCAARLDQICDLSTFLYSLNTKIHHDATVPLPKTVTTVACLSPNSKFARSGQDKVSAGWLTASAGSWDWGRGHMSRWSSSFYTVTRQHHKYDGCIDTEESSRAWSRAGNEPSQSLKLYNHREDPY